MRQPGRKCFGGFLAVALAYISIGGLVSHLTRHANGQMMAENREWVASSKYWLDRQACRWLGLCGTMHLNSYAWTWDNADDAVPPDLPDTTGYWTSGTEDPDSWSPAERRLREIPQYVFDHAPYVHLFSGEEFWPCDLAEHLAHTSPTVNYTKILDLENDANLTNLGDLNDYDGGHHGRFMYLQSDDNVEERPKWLGGAKNIPRSPEAEHDPEDDAAWPDRDGWESAAEQQQQQHVSREPVPAPESDDFEHARHKLVPSTDGRCGGNSGATCKGSGFGPCCSIYGWCGNGDGYCGDPCDILSGECNDPFEPVPRPKQDLRRRARGPPAAAHRPPRRGESKAPAILVVVPKGDGIVDAFWFFFYSYNLGQKVLNVRFGNHVGDWEHTMIRFEHGRPTSAALSEHNFGDAVAWHALEKYLPNPDGSGTMIGTWGNLTAAHVARRPVVYSAVGSHAMYATPGLHPYILPWGLLHDQTDRGPLWDPSLNLQAFTYAPDTQTLRAATRNPHAPVSWFHYAGHWGDKFYPLSDPRQYRLAGQYHYVNGPTGPKFKNLARRNVCQTPAPICRVRHWADEGRARRPPFSSPIDGGGDEEEGGLPGGNVTDDAPLR